MGLVGVQEVAALFHYNPHMTRRVAVLFAFVTIVAVAQQTSPASVDVGEEPKHHLVFKNEYVRAFEVTVPVGTETLIHRHTKPYIYVSIGDADVRNEVVGKDPATIHPKDGEVRFVQGGFAHKAVNVGKTDFRNVTVELLKADSADSKPADVARQQLTECSGSNCSENVWFPGGHATTVSTVAGIGMGFRPGEHNVLVIALQDVILTRSSTSTDGTEIKRGNVMWLADAGGMWVHWHPEKNAHQALPFVTYLEFSH